MKLEKIVKIFAFLVIFGLTMALSGIASNVIVKDVNDGYMPVVSQTFEKPVIIDEEHRFQKYGKLLLLADRIEVNIPQVEKYTQSKILGHPIKLLVKRLGLPTEGDNIIASIGDIMQWFGFTTIILFTPFLLLTTHLLSKETVRSGKNWRGKDI